MSVGQGSLISPLSYMAVGRETTLGTYTTCTSSFSFMSTSMKTTQEKKQLEEVKNKRFMSQIIKLGKVVEGDLEGYFYPDNSACAYILQNAFGGSITSATATGETVGGGTFTHQIDIGSMGLTYPALCLNLRKGETTSGKVFEYNGVRVNELGLSAEIDDALKIKASVIGFNSTITTNDVSAALTCTSIEALDFIGGRLSVEGTYASLTSTSFWEVQSFELSLSNSLKADSDSRRIGTDILDVLPVGMGNIEVTAGIRFDTTTAFDAMLNKTKLSMQLEFEGSTYSGSLIKRGLKIDLPVVYINDAGDPEIGGPDEILKSEVSFKCLTDCSSAGGFPIRAFITNQIADYN